MCAPSLYLQCTGVMIFAPCFLLDCWHVIPTLEQKEIILYLAHLNSTTQQQ